MKNLKKCYLLSFFVVLSFAANAQKVALKVGTNPTTIDPSAVLEIESTTKGFAMPRMTNTQRKAIAAPIEGLQVYDTTLKGIYIYDGLKWDCGNNPAGSVNYFANSTAPNGYLECNGQSVNRNTYAELFAAIGIVYGAGNGSTTFNLPDLRGEFVRGLDKGRGVDAGRLIGTKQKASIIGYDLDTSGVWRVSASDLTLAGSQFQLGLDAYTTTDYSGVLLNGAALTVEGVDALPGQLGLGIFGGSGVTRPRNLALLPCIKF